MAGFSSRTVVVDVCGSRGEQTRQFTAGLDALTGKLRWHSRPEPGLSCVERQQATPTEASSVVLQQFVPLTGRAVVRDVDTGRLVWQGDNRVGSFAERSVQLNGAVNWTIDNRQELRVKLQALGLEARARQGWDAQPDGHALASAVPVDDFSLRNLGFQIRYRYELAPLSYVYVVYGRGGDMFNDYWQSSGSLLGDAFSLRDAEQLVVKFTYRFEL